MLSVWNYLAALMYADASKQQKLLMTRHEAERRIEMSENLMEVKHLKKYFETPKGMLHAVDDVTFSIGKGKTMGVVGESGCGKSTLGRTVIRLLNPTNGQVIYKGTDLATLSGEEMRKLRQEIQIIFQDPYASLNPRMTVRELIQAPLDVYSHESEAEKLAKVKNIMAKSRSS